MEHENTFEVQPEYAAQEGHEVYNCYSAEVLSEANAPAVEYFAAMDMYFNQTTADRADDCSIIEDPLPREALALAVSQRYALEFAEIFSSVFGHQQDLRAQVADYQLAQLDHRHKVHFDQVLNLKKNAEYKDYLVKHLKNQTEHRNVSATQSLTTA